MKTRLEHDSLGEIQVPADAYYGVQTLRAMVNFKDISGITIGDHPYYVKALAMVKWAAAHANMSLGTLDEEIGVAIKKACEEIIEEEREDLPGIFAGPWCCRLYQAEKLAAVIFVKYDSN